MNDFAQNVGWLLFLALCMGMVSHLVYAIVVLVWRQGAIGEVVDGNDALIATAKTVGSWFKLLKSSWLATVCAVATLLLLWGTTEVGFYVSLGYAAMTYSIGGVIAPMILRRLKPIAASQTTQAPSPEKSSDS